LPKQQNLFFEIQWERKMNKLDELFSGKAKSVYATDDAENNKTCSLKSSGSEK